MTRFTSVRFRFHLAAWLLLQCVLAGAAFAQGSSRAEALHVLNRLSFGPAPGDLERVMQTGVDRYIDAQLHPEQIPVPPALTRKLDALRTTHLSQGELIAWYRQTLQQVRTDRGAGEAARRDMAQTMAQESGQARLLRALQSPRQLEEVMVDFWFNHFNVFSGKGMDRVLVENYEREAIRPFAMGKFRDLLGATAHHPAMLFYLDNWLSAAPGYQAGRNAPNAARPTGLNENWARELMELHTLGVDGGYSQRDVTELARMLTGWTINPRRAQTNQAFWFDAARHDDGSKVWLGYTVTKRGQAEGEWALDVLAAAPATARHISFQLAQYFVSDAPPDALVERLSQRFLQTGGDIRAVLQTLFASPEFRNPGAYNAKFKTPWRYLLSGVRASGLAHLTNVRPLLATAAQLGMPLYGCPTPDGYSNTEQAWLNPDAITRRVNFAVALAAGKLPLARPMDADPAANPAQPGMAPGVAPPANPDWLTAPVDADALLATLGNSLSTATMATVNASEPRLRAALVLGSPDFMRH